MIKSTRSGWRSVLALEAVLVMVAMTGANVAATEPYRGTPGDVDDPRVALRNAVVKQLEPLQAQLRSTSPLASVASGSTTRERPR